jgi:hypothetical protein
VFLFDCQFRGEAIQIYPQKAWTWPQGKGIAMGAPSRIFTRKIRGNVQENSPTHSSESSRQTLISQVIELGHADRISSGTDLVQ